MWHSHKKTKKAEEASASSNTRGGTSRVSHIFEHRWESVVVAHASLRYPCPLRPDIVRVDFLSRGLDPTGNVLSFSRLLTCSLNTRLPAFITRALFSKKDKSRDQQGESDGNSPACRGSNITYFQLEKTVIDKTSRIMTITNENLSFAKAVSLREKCLCICGSNSNAVKQASFPQSSSLLSQTDAETPDHPRTSESSPRTLWSQQLHVRVHVLPTLLAHSAERLVASRYPTHTSLGWTITESAIDKLRRQGVLHDEL
ncbi:hypothetical protein Pelo_293 [Pelomyxa schiedti]|nr:hypothetical protein Pelo_293 [Pelomyxa schiedti]